MANTYTSLHYHLVFSTKAREPWITTNNGFQQRLWAYFGGIARENGMTALKVGRIEDHVHMVTGIPPVMAISKAVQLLKGGAATWVHDTFPALAAFGWQDGYGAFAVSKSNLAEVIAYVENQREHHASMTFESEYVRLLEKHDVAYDNRYLWG